MCVKILSKIYDNSLEDSIATRLRKKRLKLFTTLIGSVPRPIRILDIGGTEVFWETMNYTGNPDIEVVLLNLYEIKTKNKNFSSVVGDASCLSGVYDKEFDVVFSNSVIEHIVDRNGQLKMVAEVKRAGKKYFIQTPNRYFPIEPHFLFPLFQFLPITVRTWLVMNFNMGWYKKTDDFQKAKMTANSIKLLTYKELKIMFPDATIYREKFLGMTKSFVIYGG
jgi:ubiquinone/menaquinone biosynthesis C-methylase UbiE